MNTHILLLGIKRTPILQLKGKCLRSEKEPFKNLRILCKINWIPYLWYRWEQRLRLLTRGQRRWRKISMNSDLQKINWFWNILQIHFKRKIFWTFRRANRLLNKRLQIFTSYLFLGKLYELDTWHFVNFEYLVRILTQKKSQRGHLIKQSSRSNLP